MNTKKYTALIRTQNSHPIVVDVVAALRAQTHPPETILAVDSASSPEQKLKLNSIVDKIIDYPNEPFNYSKAINIGVQACLSEYVLIISSHVVIQDIHMIQNGLELIQNESQNCLGFCLIPTPTPEKTWQTLKVNNKNFSPLIGLSNSCAFLQVQPIINRPFREDVFSAEDQEWAAYYLRNQNSYFFSITSHHLKYSNPHTLNKHTYDLKKMNEIISMAYFTHPQLRSPKMIISRLLRSILAFIRNRPDRAKLHLTLAKELFLAHFRKPVRKSSYY